MRELLKRACLEDPVRGFWQVSPHGAVTVRTDASSLGLGVALEVNGSIVEDASWLRKQSDHLHIKFAELEGVGSGHSVGFQDLNQSINQSINQPTNQSINLSIYQSINQSINIFKVGT